MATEYPKLVAWLEKHQKFGCPKHISLGTKGSFFITMMDKSAYWRFPKSVSRDLGEYTVASIAGSIRRFWFGYNDDYVAEMDTAEYEWRIDSYGSLEQRIVDALNREDEGIKVNKPNHSTPFTNLD